MLKNSADKQVGGAAVASGPNPGNLSTEEILLRGVVARITYQNAESGFGVIRVTPENIGSEQETTVVGVFPSTLSLGANIIARGAWQTHAKFGKQFRARSVTETEPTTTDALVKYLGSGSIKGFGPVLAERVVTAFGDDTLRILNDEPEKLRDVPGIGEKKFQEIRGAWEQKKNLREVLLFFQGHNVPLGLAQRIYNAYGDKAIEKVRENPYILARDVWGIGFLTADKIAQALGIDPRSSARIAAGLEYTLKRGGDDGHCFLPRDLLIAKASSLLSLADEERIAEILDQSIREGALISENESIYSPLLHLAEVQVAENLAARLTRGVVFDKDIPEHLIEAACGRSLVTSVPSGSGLTENKVIRLSEKQKDAIRLAATEPLIVITGGPGCGKTTVVKTISSLYKSAGLSIKLAAPTGRAAQRLAEVCEMEASTIHRMLKFDPQTRGFVHDHNDPLPVDAIIVDESSMIDISLASALLRAIPLGARIVIVGDADQLPSVGPGLFLSDLLQMKSAPRVLLDTLFRRAEESAITSIAYSINHSQVPEIPEPDGQTKSDAYFLPAKELTQAAELIERLVVEQIPKRFGFSGSDITVLTPMNQGELGVIALNKRLQARIRPHIPGTAEVNLGDNLVFRLGDRVCQRVNNYNITSGGVFNGDQGEIVGIDLESRSIRVKLWDGREVDYGQDAIYQLDLAYALTIHRSQGSEVPVVVLALHDSHTVLLERQLIYTAVTRAKKLLIVVGTKRALVLATKRARSRRRYTALTSRTENLLIS